MDVLAHVSKSLSHTRFGFSHPARAPSWRSPPRPRNTSDPGSPHWQELKRTIWVEWACDPALSVFQSGGARDASWARMPQHDDRDTTGVDTHARTIMHAGF